MAWNSGFKTGKRPGHVIEGFVTWPGWHTANKDKQSLHFDSFLFPGFQEFKAQFPTISQIIRLLITIALNHYA